MITGLVRSAKGNTCITCRPDQLSVRRHSLDTLDGLGKRHRNNIPGLQSHHHAALFAGDGPHCTRTKISRQHAVECIWPATALEMSENHATRLTSGKLFKILLQVLADAT